MAQPRSAIPVVGITLDSEPAGGLSKYPWYAVRENYCAAVVAAGGLPVLLPHEPERAEAYLERIDALLVTGGAFDVDPALFGANRSEEHTSELQSLMRISYAVFCLKKKKKSSNHAPINTCYYTTT